MTWSAGLVVERLGVRYPGRREPALREIDLTVGAGEFVGVEGRTGAGKSTLALISAGFVPRVVRARVEGSVTVAGVSAVTSSPGELAERVGIVFSTPANQLSASKLTVREELAFGLENLGVPRADMDGRIDDVLEHLGIAHLSDREPFSLSGGEQQRVAIASIIAMGTSVVVLDEPTAQLDPGGTAAVAALLRSLADDGRAILAAEHDPTVLALAARCLILPEGRSVALDRPGSVLGSATLAPIGLRPPTIVDLAERAGVDAARAFDEDAVVDALRRPGAGGPAAAARGADLAAAAAVQGADLAAAARRAEPSAADRDAVPGAWAAPPAPAVEAIREVRPTDVSVAGLVHRYPGGIEAVRGVNLHVPAGETVAILGQNGSGKTTLVKHLNGLLRPDAGSVAVGGRDLAGEPVNVVARSVGFVFQNPDDQLFGRSVEREVGFGPRNLRLDRTAIARLVERSLDLVGLAGTRAANPYDLDLSQRKLVAFASVLAMDPAVLVLDEPTTGQDGPGRERVGSIVDRLADAGRTVIAITHDMEFAAAHFGRIVVMREGRIVADGSPADVFAASTWEVLASTGLVAPVAARVGARLGLGATPTEASLVEALAARAR